MLFALFLLSEIAASFQGMRIPSPPEDQPDSPVATEPKKRSSLGVVAVPATVSGTHLKDSDGPRQRSASSISSFAKK